MRCFLFILVVAAIPLLASCGDEGEDCSGLRCGPCGSATLELTVPGAPDGLATGRFGSSLFCGAVMDEMASCNGSLDEDTVTIAVPGYERETVTLTHIPIPPRGGCCPCDLDDFEGAATLTPLVAGGGAMDGAVDASVDGG